MTSGVNGSDAPYRPTVLDRLQRRAFAGLLALPRSLRRRAAGTPHIVDAGALDPDIATGLKVLGALGEQAPVERDVWAARESLAAEAWMFAGEPDEVASSEAVTIDGASFGASGDIPALLHRPLPSPVDVVGKHAEAARPDDAAPPLLVYFHGGGWVVGSHHTHDAVARAFCAGGEVVVLNVHYRLAPEYPFPAAVDDALAAFLWAHAHADELGIDPDRIAVAGDSAGGNLAAVVSQVATRREGPRPAMQLLFVPVTELTLPRSDSYVRFSEGYFLTRAAMDWYEANYLTAEPVLRHDVETLRADPRVSPLQAEDLEALAVAGLPPAYVAVAGFDPLRDEGVAYARELARAGVPTTLRIHTDAVHPFINILATDLGRRCMTEAIGALRMGLRVM